MLRLGLVATAPLLAAERMVPRWAWLAVALLLSMSGCKGSRPAAAPDPVSRATSAWSLAGKLDTSGLSLHEDDLNGDGRSDHRVWLRSKQDPTSRVRSEWDINHDGRIDNWQFFDARGQLEREEYDLDFDGRVDQIAFILNGVVVKRETSTDFKDRMAVRKLYDLRGNLTTIEQDTDADGKLDTWEFYDQGKLIRIGRDTNEDEREDTFSEPTETRRKQAEESLKAAATPPTLPAGLPAAPGGNAGVPMSGQPPSPPASP